VKGERITLAPPTCGERSRTVARRVCRIHPGLYDIFNAMPFLRTHVLAWVGKGAIP